MANDDPVAGLFSVSKERDISACCNAAVGWDRAILLSLFSELLILKAAAGPSVRECASCNAILCNVMAYLAVMRRCSVEFPHPNQCANTHTNTRHILHSRDMDNCSIKPADSFGREFLKRMALAGTLAYAPF